MTKRESQIIIGCRECEQNQRETLAINGFAPFPTTTSFPKRELGTLSVSGYTCLFCGDKLEMTDIMLDMCTQLMDGPAHIVSHPDATEVLSTDTHVHIPHNQEFQSLEPLWAEYGIHVEGLDELVFRNPQKDLTLIHQAMSDFDTSKWLLMIESSGNPEPYPKDDAFWFSIMDDPE
ncbi:hypothetical protein [Lentibacillus salinarum]|uniref:CpXC domain-containing protein n=1 Tax=Lentibacillus salinarum TaxID=446820 RepID=A0ABW3ZXU4_9BACI